MASKKFGKGTAEFDLLGDFYKLCQRVWVPEDNDDYWEYAIKEMSDFGEKYRDADDIFTLQIVMALAATLEQKSARQAGKEIPELIMVEKSKCRACERKNAGSCQAVVRGSNAGKGGEG